MKARISSEPALHERSLVNREVVEDDVDLELGLNSSVEFAQERDEVLGPVLFVGPREHFACGDVEGCEEIKGPVADVVVVCRSGIPMSMGRIGWARSRAWICGFSSKEKTTA